MGHCLGTGIVDDDKAAAVAAHLVGPLLNSGFEVRTLATDMNAFTPMSYHNGSVWPHDTAIAIKGLANYSFVEETQQDCGLLDASEYFGGRLPELFCAFSRAEFTCPLVSCGLQLQVSSALTRFAVAASWCQCPPQSWGSDDEGGPDRCHCVAESISLAARSLTGVLVSCDIAGDILAALLAVHDRLLHQRPAASGADYTRWISTTQGGDGRAYGGHF